MKCYQSCVRPLLFRFDPESVHELISNLLRLPLAASFLGLLYRRRYPELRRTVFGLTFENPVGLAAGFDKNARMISPLTALGFGFIEIGTVTPRPQEGNPRPRLFRLPADKALINRMGFNNQGAEAVCRNLRRRRRNIIIGGNIGKNKLTPNSRAAEDYLLCFEALYEHVDYFVVNVSSPNTPGLRALQEGEALRDILGRLKAGNAVKPVPKPILLKIAPDLTNAQLDEIISIVRETGTDGIVAANTTTARTGLTSAREKVDSCGEGGLSGLPLKDRSTEIIKYLAEKTRGAVPIIGVGGIHAPDDAIEKLNAGASLVQLYTGFIYEGPGLIKRINHALHKRPHR